jgi:hypothetical protein
MNADARTLHALKNQLSIVLGFSELLVAEAAPDDPRRRDFQEIHKAAVAALGLIEQAAAPEVP